MITTTENHLKNQLQRDFNNNWMYSGDYSLDYNYNNNINLWAEISEENYFDQLECLPPMKFNGKNFLISEALTGNIHACLMKVNNRYFGKYVNKFLVDYVKFENEIRQQYNIITESIRKLNNIELADLSDEWENPTVDTNLYYQSVLCAYEVTEEIYTKVKKDGGLCQKSNNKFYIA